MEVNGEFCSLPRTNIIVYRGHQQMQIISPELGFLPSCMLVTIQAQYTLWALVLWQHMRGVQKVLQLDHIEEWKCYKLHFIFQYNLY